MKREHEMVDILKQQNEEIEELWTHIDDIKDDVKASRRQGVYTFQEQAKQQHREAAVQQIVGGWPLERDGLTCTVEHRESYIKWVAETAGLQFNISSILKISHQTGPDYRSPNSIIFFQNEWQRKQFDKWASASKKTDTSYTTTTMPPELYIISTKSTRDHKSVLTTESWEPP